MPSSFTERSRYTKQATGEGSDVWGVILNEGVFELIDQGMDGVITLTASTALTTENGAEDQARYRILNYTGASPGTITIPSVEKWYIVRAATRDCTITNGSNSVTVAAGGSAIVLTDASNVWILRDAAMATKAFVEQTAFNANAGILPGQGSGIVGFLQTNNGSTAWVALTPAMVSGLEATLTSLQSQINLKANQATTYTKTEVDALISAAAKIKAWALFLPSPVTIPAGSGLSAVKVGPGVYRFTFSQVRPDANYAVFVTSCDSIATGLIGRVDPTQKFDGRFDVIFTTPTGTAADPSQVFVQVVA